MQGFQSSNQENLPSEEMASNAMGGGPSPGEDMAPFNSVPPPESEEQQAMQEGPQGHLGHEDELNMFAGNEPEEQQQEFGPRQEPSNEGIMAHVNGHNHAWDINSGKSYKPN